MSDVPDGYDDPESERFGRYYDRQGERISLHEWGDKRQDEVYCQIGYSELWPYRISTIWLGIPSPSFGPRPLIFETMVFADDETDELANEQWRWATEAEAYVGHHGVVAIVRARLAHPPITKGR